MCGQSGVPLVLPVHFRSAFEEQVVRETKGSSKHKPTDPLGRASGFKDPRDDEF